jgi:hypothetical protein
MVFVQGIGTSTEFVVVFKLVLLNPFVILLISGDESEGSITLNLPQDEP